MTSPVTSRIKSTRLQVKLDNKGGSIVRKRRVVRDIWRVINRVDAIRYGRPGAREVLGCFFIFEQLKQLSK